ncbi:cobaltochelatase subunit CobN [Oculatella sp. LEGE 06141]|uniref:cobaltochelatase subunit CobN n=1 Tax=Oculatella sp. LEGE 06141 TaxID=1828648 RepID=UPI00188296B4|nr:cobaltochelatase subunit CobN [Oculatella sp. LEGE 06141]MBE9177410.1 cobaltochelatase subunit CobN [Oculatella sp. LEGE 06141]
MHRLAATPGGWNPDAEGVVFVEQRPAPIVLLTAADTDIQVLAKAVSSLPEGFPALRVTNLLHLQQQLTIDTYAEEVLEQAQVIIVRLLGGRAYWSYGLEVVKQVAHDRNIALFVLPGDDRPDPDLSSHSTVSLAMGDRLWRYFTEGGIDNTVNALKFVADCFLGQAYQPQPPQSVPRMGYYPWVNPWVSQDEAATVSANASSAKIGLLFYRAHYLAGNTAPIDALCRAIATRQFQPVPVFVSSLRDAEVQADLLAYFCPKDDQPIRALLNTTSFSLARLEAEAPHLDLWKALDIPVLQVILSGGTLEQWTTQTRGLSPRDIAMNVALPEVDGRIISRAVSFKTVQASHPALETDVVGYEAVDDRIQFVADLAANWVRLGQTPASERRIALILANYPTRDGRLANGVGLDTPASCVEILKALRQAGYTVENIPESGEELIRWLTQGITNDPEGQSLRRVHQSLSLEEYQHYFATVPPAVQQAMGDRWGLPDANGRLATDSMPIAGIQLGNVFVGIQPARGYDLDPTLNYHAPDLEPTHHYLAYYYWLRQHFAVQAIVHVGKHGNLEWLPGKGVALSDACYPEVAFGALPHLYPFIVNDPGEGAQAKRRAQAVIVDHLTPPMTRAELYGSLQQLENLIDEYYEAVSLDPTRLVMIRERIQTLLNQTQLHQDLGLQPDQLMRQDDTVLNSIDGYLCELKEAQIRDGLHIFGCCPAGRQLRDLAVAIARHPGLGRLGLTRAIAQAWGWEFDPLTANPTEPFNDPSCRTVGDAIEQIEEEAARLVDAIIHASPVEVDDAPLRAELAWVRDRLLPALAQTHQETTHLLQGLDGRYVPSAPAGAPTRGRPDVLPTGRNFYSVDIRAIPTESAWDVGRKAAEALVERYTQENGDYPKTLGVSIWGTSTMRTGGDDLAEALALLGVRPVWDGASRRVVDFEIMSLSVLGRPRVDVTLRISGFFRDAFPNLIDLFHQAVTGVAALDEPEDQNPLAAQVQRDVQTWQTAGLSPEQAQARSHYRIFGSKPGAYGAGLQGIIDAQNWTDDHDLAQAYINWSSYAYTGQGDGQTAPEAFEKRLSQMQIVLHNQDNREHDLLDSDDYYQFQGGLTAAVRSLTGQNPQTYFGDHSLPEHPKIRHLQDEIARVYRSRVVNPKWIAGAMRHGYKGAFEMAATVDYLFAYDATARCVEDHMYQGITEAYVFDPAVQAFVQQNNPWALRDMAERLLEAHQRGLWQQVKPTTLDQLQAIALEAEATIESNVHPGILPSQ